MPKKNLKICFAASSGGHFEQLMMLEPLMNKYDSFILTERTEYKVNCGNDRIYFVKQVNREGIRWIPRMIFNFGKSLYIYMKEKPDVVICTGVLSMIPMCLIIKFFGGKLVYLESFARVTTSAKTGRLIYKFADRFYVQWEGLLKVFPKAVYLGSVY